MLYRIELHGRPVVEDQEEWSLRQSAIYQRLGTKNGERAVFLIIDPSPQAETTTQEFLQGSTGEASISSPFYMHLQFLSPCIRNWRWYLSRLESRLADQVRLTLVTCLYKANSHQSDRVVSADIECSSDPSFPHSEFKVTVIDRQRLNILETLILNMQVVFQSTLKVVVNLKVRTIEYCELYCIKGCDCQNIAEQLEELAQDLHMYQYQSEILYKGVQGTAKLVSKSQDNPR